MAGLGKNTKIPKKSWEHYQNAQYVRILTSFLRFLGENLRFSKRLPLSCKNYLVSFLFFNSRLLVSCIPWSKAKKILNPSTFPSFYSGKNFDRLLQIPSRSRTNPLFPRVFASRVTNFRPTELFYTPKDAS